MIEDVEDFFSCFAAICYSSVENSLFSSVLHISIGLFVSLESNFLSSLYMDIRPLLDVGLLKIFSQFVGYCFVLLTVSFTFQKLCNFTRSHLSNLFLFFLFVCF